MQIPCTISKKSGNTFVKCQDCTIKNLHKPYANAITKTYANHPFSSDGSNVVLVWKTE